MKNLKMFKAAILIIVFSILTGCSDQITSSGETGSSEKGEEVNSSASLRAGLPIKLPVVPTLRTKIILKPFVSYTFNEFNSKFDRYYSIDIDELYSEPTVDKKYSECDNIVVYSPTSGVKLNCHSKGIDVSDITVENTSPRLRYLDVSIRGVRQKKDIE